jgi:serine/threonine-protein kinase
MAVVFRARDEHLGRLVALKILAPGHAADPEFRQRFIAESRAAAAVDDPHIIPVYEAGEADGALFIAMRFVQGGDLRQVLLREGALAPDRAAGFISPVASALDAAHRAGLVHRDVKPANVLVDAREDRPDHVYLSDFGVSKRSVSAAALTGVGVFLGTPDYSAPEQIEGGHVDGRTDQYALACVAYHLLTGVVPFERDQPMAVMLAHVSQPAPSVVSRRPELPAAVDQVVAKGMAKAQQDRYESCSDFADALRDALGLAPYRRRRSAAASPRPPLPAASPPEGPSQPEALPSGTPPPGTPSRPEAPPSGTPSPVAAAIAFADPAVGGGPGPGSADPPGAEADADAGPAGPRRRLHRLTARKRRGPPPKAAVLAGEGTPTATAAATAESRRAGEPETAARPGEPASSQAPASASAETSPPPGAVPIRGVPAEAVPAEAVPVTGSGFPGGRTTPSPPPVSPPAEAPLPSAAAASALVVRADAASGPAVWTTVHPPPGGGPAGGSEMPRTAGATGPGPVGRETGNGASTAPPMAGMDAPTDPGSGVAAPGRHPKRSIADLPAAIIVLIRRYRLPVIVVACAILAAAGTFPFILTSPANSPSRGNPHTKGNPPQPAGPPIYSLRTIVLPAGYIDPVTSLAFSPSGGTLAIAASYLCLWDTTTRDCAPGPGLTSASSVAFSPDGDILAAGDNNVGENDGKTFLWNIVGKRLQIGSLQDSASEGVNAVAFSPDGSILAAGDGNGSTYLWNVATEKLIAALPDSSTRGVYAVAFSHDGKMLAAGDGNGSTYLWNVATRKLIARLPGPPKTGALSVAFSRDSTILAVGYGNGDGTDLWSVGTGRLITTLTDARGTVVESVAFSPDGEILAVGDGNGKAYLWNVTTKKLIKALTDPSGASINAIAFSPDGGTLACGNANGRADVYLWHTS